SAPQHWIGGFGAGSDHVLVTLHALSAEAMTSYSDRLGALFSEGGAFREIWRADGMALMETKDGRPVPTTKVHFGYTDGISMTAIRGGPERYPPDHQERCDSWLFVLRDDAENYFVPEPRQFGLNGSFAVFKMMETDVVGFERGLLGYFINSSIENQYEFVLGHWVNDSEFAGAVRLPPKSKDPMIGTQNLAESIFVIPQAHAAPIKITEFSSFVTTKAAA